MSWNDYISHYLLSEGKCYAGALGNSSDYKLFAAQGATSEEEGWAATFSEDFVTEVLVDEVTERTERVTINEATALREAMETGTTSQGLFIGGNKYRIVKYETDFDCAGQEVVCLFGALGKKGVCVINTGTMLVMGMYDEELGQTGGNCKSACAAFAEYYHGLSSWTEVTSHSCLGSYYRICDDFGDRRRPVVVKRIAVMMALW